MNEMKRPYERPAVVTYSASQVLSMLGPAKAVYGAIGGGRGPDPETLLTPTSGGPQHPQQY